MVKASDRDRLSALLAPVVSAQGLDLERVDVAPAGKRALVRIVVDQDGGVGLDAVAKVSSAVSAALDQDPSLGSSPYVLEVTSPGVDRPLTEPRHWRRALHRLVNVATAEGTDVHGRLIEVDGAGIVVGNETASTRLGWDRVSSGRVQVEFNRPGTDAPAGEE